MKLRQISPAQRYRKNKNKGFRMGLWQRMHGRCWYCGAKIKFKEMILDHQEPFSKGGADSKRNLAPSCSPCDREKGARTLDEYRTLKRAQKGDQGFCFYGEAK